MALWQKPRKVVGPTTATNEQSLRLGEPYWLVAVAESEKRSAVGLGKMLPVRHAFEESGAFLAPSMHTVACDRQQLPRRTTGVSFLSVSIVDSSVYNAVFLS